MLLLPFLWACLFNSVLLDQERLDGVNKPVQRLGQLICGFDWQDEACSAERILGMTLWVNPALIYLQS